MHELTKRILAISLDNHERDLSQVVNSWVLERAIWLKCHAKIEPYHFDIIDMAFQIEPKTLEEKFRETKIVDDHGICYYNISAQTCEKLARIAEEHFRSKP